MPKLLFSHAEIVDSSGSALSPTAKLIYAITVEGVEISKEPQTVAIEDGRTINESFAGSITIRTINTQFGSDNAGGDILGLTTHISSNGSPAANKAGIKLHGAGSGPDIVIYPAYVMGHRDFSNGRVETVISATAESTSQGIVARV